MSWLAVIGAGHDQLQTYHEARRLGLRTVAFDANPEAPGGRLADEFHAVDVRDVGAILDRLDGLDVVGVVAPGVDRGLPSVRRLSQKLGFKCAISERASQCSVDKTVFRHLLVALDLPRYPGIEVGSEPWTDRPELPVVVKPVDSSGSKGLSVVEDPSDLDHALAVAADFAPDGRVLIEKLLDGRHLSAEVFMDAGSIGALMLTERFHTACPGMITLAHRSPASLDSKTAAAIAESIQLVANAIDLVDGPMNVDMVVVDGVPYLIEMGARIGGNGMPRLMRLSSGIDTVRANIELSIGRRPDLAADRDRVAMLLILASDTSGTVRSVEISEDLRTDRRVADLEVFVAPGDVARPYDRAANKLGYLTLDLDGDDSASPATLLADLASRIRITVVDERGQLDLCEWRSS